MKSVMVAFTFIVLAFLNIAHAQTKAGVFYSITGKGSKDTSWLFGTYHLINESYLNEIPAVRNAAHKASNLVVEVIIDSSQLMQANAKILLQNKQLSQLLGKSFADSLDAELKLSTGQDIARFETLKPMMVLLTLSIIYLMKDNGAMISKYTGVPLDVSFVNSFKADNKTTVALETINQQMDLLFTSISEEQQVAMLQQFIRNKERAIQSGDELLKTYFDNDINKIYDIYQQEVRESGDMEFLIKDRNDNWMKMLPGLISQQSQFIAVGALHLAGPDGLPAQLQKMGYTVTSQSLQ